MERLRNDELLEYLEKCLRDSMMTKKYVKLQLFWFCLF